MAAARDRFFGIVLALGGALLGAFVVAIWVGAYREARTQPGAGHFLVPFTGGAAIFLAGAVSAVAIGLKKALSRR
jgi:hypothetical protein